MQITEDQGVIKITGVLHIAEAEAARDALVDLAAKQRCLALDLSAVEACDPSAIQLFCSLRNSGAQSNKAVVIVAWSTALADAASSLGLSIGDLVFDPAPGREGAHA